MLATPLDITSRRPDLHRLRGRWALGAAVLLLPCLGAQARTGGQVRFGGKPGTIASSADRASLPRPGYLGVSLRDLDAAEATRLHLHGAMGAMIVTVDRDAPAWGAGLRPSDVIVEFNGEPVSGVEDLRRRLRACTQGQSVTLRLRRSGAEMTIAVTMGDEQTIAERALSRHLAPALDPPPPQDVHEDAPGFANDFASPPPPAPSPASGARGMASTLLDALIPASFYTGLEVDPLTPQLAAFFGVRGAGGLLVTAVSSGSPAQIAGLAAGDVILRAGDKPVSTRSGLAHALRGAKGMPMALAVLRNRREILMSLQPGRRQGH